MRPPHRHGRRFAAGVALSALLLAGLPAVGPASPAVADPPAPDQPVPGQNLRTDLDPGSYQVTLITGDQVRLDVSADQRLVLDITPARRTDGSNPEVEWYTSGDGVYVMPEDARPHLDAGLLDWKLFDVEHLALQGFTDQATDGLPLIVEYGNSGSATAMRSAGVATAAAQPLESINAAAVDVDQPQTTDLWESVQDDWSAAAEDRPAARAVTPTVEKLWLDDVAELTLDESVPQTGAPEAWDAGFDGTGVTVAVLDTGIDAHHPDVAGKIVASRNFIDEDGDASDGHGHGTHVASTIAGTGAASEAGYVGVAPAADLAVGKVCTDEGQCPHLGGHRRHGVGRPGAER